MKFNVLIETLDLLDVELETDPLICVPVFSVNLGECLIQDACTES